MPDTIPFKMGMTVELNNLKDCHCPSFEAIIIDSYPQIKGGGVNFKHFAVWSILNNKVIEWWYHIDDFLLICSNTERGKRILKENVKQINSDLSVFTQIEQYFTFD